MTFKAEKRIGVRGTADEIWERIGDLGYWNRWNPIETGVTGKIGFRQALSFTETLPGQAPRAVVAGVAEWQPYAKLELVERRGWLFASTRYFRIQRLEEDDACIFSNGFAFTGLRGEIYHDKHRRALREACDQVCEAMKASVEGGRS